ncbi:hypothetical protein T12_11223 [Trichinella patagoniensis]|uniref:Uncharacterized protein n=1 Tax=Trichinella patagoniensis TaxID=990121 RepID=A0A0V0ZDW1_9BILA|nr:hypothetical protein T12_11223 [Trichinella patagoniensis]
MQRNEKSEEKAKSSRVKGRCQKDAKNATERQNAKEWAVNGKEKAGNAEEERKGPKKKQENSIEEVKSCTQTKKAEGKAKSLKKYEFLEA